MEQYSYWFQRTFPQPSQRQAFLEELIRGKPVSAANLRLGHLLIDRSVTGLVLTTNFDPFISEALRLFGVEPLICDHPLLADRIDPDRSVVQVVHMHGSHWHYDACNVVEEILGRAEREPRARRSMLDLLGDTLRFRSPIVVGYSGWPNDVFMQGLEERLGGLGDSIVLPYNIYWFCHRRQQVEQLPEWLTRHPNVRLVIPPEGRREPARESKTHDQDPTPSLSSPEAEEEPTLDAQEVFEALLKAFSVKIRS